MTDEDLLHDRPDATFGSGVIGVCDVCGRRQAVIVLQKERFQLCVLDFLNKTWSSATRKPGAPLPPYRSERIWYPSRAEPTGRAAAIVLAPTKAVKRPGILVAPDVYGLTTSVLDGAIRFAREGFEVLLPDVARTGRGGPSSHLSMRWGTRTRGGVPLGNRQVDALVALYRDGLGYLRTRELADPSKSAVFGSSYGGTLAAVVAAREPSLAAVALAYPVPVRPPTILGAISAPMLVVTGSEDPMGRTFVREAGAAQRPGGIPLELDEVAGARHHFLSRDLPAYDLGRAEATWGRILAFYRSRLLPPPPKPPTPPAARPVPAPTPTKPAAAASA